MDYFQDGNFSGSGILTYKNSTHIGRFQVSFLIHYVPHTSLFDLTGTGPKNQFLPFSCHGKSGIDILYTVYMGYRDSK